MPGSFTLADPDSAEYVVTNHDTRNETFQVPADAPDNLRMLRSGRLGGLPAVNAQ